MERVDDFDVEVSTEMTDEEMTVTLQFEDGTRTECIPLVIFEVDKKEYIAVLPAQAAAEAEDEDEETDIYFFRYSEESGLPVFDSIETEEEFEAVRDAYEEMLDDQDFEEYFGDEDPAEE